MLSEEQENIVSMHCHGRDSVAVVQAFAGTGKTYTLQEFCRARPRKPILYLAYNKSMAVEAERKFRGQPHVVVKTLHGLAYGKYGIKYQDRLGNMTPIHLQKLVEKKFPHCSNVYGIAGRLRNWLEKFMSSASTSPAKYFTSMMEKYADDGFIPLPCRIPDEVDENEFSSTLETLWNGLVNRKRGFATIPVPHNLYLKVFQMSHPNLGFEYVLVDEAQDITDSMIALTLEQNCHKLYIGDSFQQIYSWNGAVNSLEKMQRMGAETYHLTKSFRCKPQIASVADNYLQLLGAKKHFQGNENIRKTDASVAYLGRSNASVFETAYQLVEHGGTLSFLGGIDGYNFDILMDFLAVKKGRNVSAKSQWLKEFEDYEALREYGEEDPAVASRCSLVDRYGGRLYLMYKKIKESLVHKGEKPDVVFSTAHKAKGCEWGKVTLGDDFIKLRKLLVDSSQGKPVVISSEELNLLYVAMTRAKTSLRCSEEYIIDSNIVKIFNNLRNAKRIFLKRPSEVGSGENTSTHADNSMRATPKF